jgi:hypothetical protein
MPTKEKSELKGGSPTGDARAEFIDKITEILKKDGKTDKIKEIKDLNLSDVFIGAFDAEEEHYFIMKKPIGQELADAHLDILLDMQGAEPVEETDSQGNKIRQISPVAVTARKKAMKAWFKNLLPTMLIYPDIDRLNFAEQFYMFNVVFGEMESGISTFQLLR